jgi:hypothetical protein
MPPIMSESHEEADSRRVPEAHRYAIQRMESLGLIRPLRQLGRTAVAREDEANALVDSYDVLAQRSLERPDPA